MYGADVAQAPSTQTVVRSATQSAQAALSPAAPVDLADLLGCAVGRVVDENHLQPHGIKHRVQQLDEWADIVPVFEGQKTTANSGASVDPPVLGSGDRWEVIPSS